MPYFLEFFLLKIGRDRDAGGGVKLVGIVSPTGPTLKMGRMGAKYQRIENRQARTTPRSELSHRRGLRGCAADDFFARRGPQTLSSNRLHFESAGDFGVSPSASYTSSPFLALIPRMTNSQRLATVRECFVTWITNQTGASEAIESESILIRDEFYCGRRLRTTSHHAIWFTEEDELKIFRIDGGLQCVLASDEIDAIVDQSRESVASVEASELESESESADVLPMVAKLPPSEDQIRRAA